MKILGFNISRGQENRLPPRIAGRGFDAAIHNDLTADWLANTGPADQISKASLKTLRDRSRDLERNNPYVEAILAECESNVVGPSGFVVKPKPRRVDGRVKGSIAAAVDDQAAQKIANWWADFQKRGNCDVTGQFSLPEFARMTVRATVRDGGSLVRLVDGFGGNSTRFGIQGLEIDALDPLYNDPSKRITMSIEHDQWWMPVRYHLRDIRRDGHNFIVDRIPVDAEDLLHIHRPHRFSATQSPPWISPVMLALRHLNEFEHAEVVAARAEAENPGFFKETGEGRYTGEEMEDGRLVRPSAPGQWERLPAGVDPFPLDPKHPNAGYPDFRKAVLRQICAAFPANYNIIAQDLEGVSFSSIRQGVLSERDQWRVIQAFFIDAFLVPIYDRALLMALTSGQIEGLSVADYPRLVHKEVSGRSWNWVDPLKDVEAKAAEVALGINSRQNIAREAGRADFAAIVAENEEDKSKLEDAGLYSEPVKSAPDPKEEE
jgi:lambda family phage portal protein